MNWRITSSRAPKPHSAAICSMTSCCLQHLCCRGPGSVFPRAALFCGGGPTCAFICRPMSSRTTRCSRSQIFFSPDHTACRLLCHGPVCGCTGRHRSAGRYIDPAALAETGQFFRTPATVRGGSAVPKGQARSVGKHPVARTRALSSGAQGGACIAPCCPAGHLEVAFFRKPFRGKP